MFCSWIFLCGGYTPVAKHVALTVLETPVTVLVTVAVIEAPVTLSKLTVVVTEEPLTAVTFPEFMRLDVLNVYCTSHGSPTAKPAAENEICVVVADEVAEASDGIANDVWPGYVATAV
jgi:hypothetical protein